MQPGSIIPDLSNAQSWNRYSYVTNRPVNFNDPTGHMLDQGEMYGSDGCSDPKYCRDGKPKPKEELAKMREHKKPIWSTANFKNEELGNYLAKVSTGYQHLATVSSSFGALSEIGLTTAGLFGGSAAVGWLDLGIPIADVTGGLAGGLVGWEVGHGFHLLVTNPVESFFSTASIFFTYASDLALGNTRLDIYDTHMTAVIGQPTATSTALAFVCNMSTTGIVDTAIDGVGSLYASGKIGGVYDLLGMTGKSLSVPQLNITNMGPLFEIQFGDT